MTNEEILQEQMHDEFNQSEVLDLFEVREMPQLNSNCFIEDEYEYNFEKYVIEDKVDKIDVKGIVKYIETRIKKDIDNYEQVVERGDEIGDIIFRTPPDTRSYDHDGEEIVQLFCRLDWNIHN